MLILLLKLVNVLFLHNCHVCVWICQSTYSPAHSANSVMFSDGQLHCTMFKIKVFYITLSERRIAYIREEKKTEDREPVLRFSRYKLLVENINQN